MRRAGTVSCRRHESLQEEHAEQPEEEAEERLRGVGGGAPDGGGRAEQHQHARGVETEVVPDSIVWPGTSGRPRSAIGAVCLARAFGRRRGGGSFNLHPGL